MTPSAILACFVALALLDLGWGSFLTALNYRRVAHRAGEVPESLAGSLSSADASKAAAYSLARMRLSFVDEPIGTAAILAATVLGLFGLLDDLVASAIGSAYWRGAAFLGAALLVQAVLSVPFSLYSTFSLERRFGFNTTKLGTWILDGLKNALVSAAIGLPLLYLLYLFMDGTGSLWWVLAAAAYSAVSVVMTILYPLVIAPLFNKFSPLPDGGLSTRITELARSLGFRVNGVFVMDGSKRSRHSNAYFTGLGKSKRIVLYDTLIAQSSEDEVLAVLAHEIGHEKRHHVLKMTAVSVAMSFVAFYVLDLMMGWEALYAAFGFARESRHAILLILGLVSGPATFFLVPAFSAWSRRYEYEADRYAARAVGPQAISSALVRLNRENASNLWPHPLYSAWYYGHPALVERLAAIAGSGGSRRRTSC